MTLPTSYSWFPVGQRQCVPYEASQGRRVNAIGAHFTHGPAAGDLHFRTWACLPKSHAKKQRKTPEQVAAGHGLTAAEVGAIDAQRLVDFIWRMAGREEVVGGEWKRERPLMVVLDNYSVHRSQVVREEEPALAAADIHLVYLPSYSPELSAIEPVWHDVKQHHLPIRSFERVGELKAAVDEALACKARKLRQVHAISTNIQQSDT
ncbi:MAG: hypothetical protein AVDCRST_MAG93-296 [uncultured Chloroflexia bacterium]|uniref:Tc1-like transposase DDE domain-containing protein n=1 Tax=uncultured Chloroflexia bacterium TaxID=1672391 RepID=A0A6J4HC86_9CHLR|nr:MAG: hypothetical protein AVDCRST_MAG93-296 [uncultured Chloroflexia bacterium]